MVFWISFIFVNFKFNSKCSQLLSMLPKVYLGKPLLTKMLNQEQWKLLMEINSSLCDDFQMRRELLLTRLDVTVQSFKWADRLKDSSQEIGQIYREKRKKLQAKPNVKLYMLVGTKDGDDFCCCLKFSFDPRFIFL